MKNIILFLLVGILLNANEIITINNIIYQNQKIETSDNKRKNKVPKTFQEFTKLMKGFSINPRKTTWSNANFYCKNLQIENYTNWRLPTHQELEKICTVNIYYGLGDYKNIDEFQKQHLANAKKHVTKIKDKRLKSSIGSEMIIKKEFIENMPLINSKKPLGDFWTKDERDNSYAMSMDLRNALAWWANKEGWEAYVICVKDK